MEAASNPNNAQDYTEFLPSQALYWERNLPVETGVFRVPKVGQRSLLKDPDGNPVRGPAPKSAELYDFPNIPNRIYSKVEDWRMEMFMKMSPLAELKDITDRMVGDVTTNSISQKPRRYRQSKNKNFLLFASTKRSESSHPRLVALDSLSQAQINAGVFWMLAQNGQIAMPPPRNGLRTGEVWMPIWRTTPANLVGHQRIDPADLTNLAVVRNYATSKGSPSRR